MMNFFKQEGKFLALACAFLALSTTIISFGMNLIGFTAVGIAAGTKAAAIHSSIGIVSKGSIFAFLQSLGAKGLIAKLGWGGLTIVTSILRAIYGIFKPSSKLS
jgi:hypothetical protein